MQIEIKINGILQEEAKKDAAVNTVVNPPLPENTKTTATEETEAIEVGTPPIALFELVDSE